MTTSAAHLDARPDDGDSPPGTPFALPPVVWFLVAAALALRLLAAYRANLTFDERAHLALAETIRWDTGGVHLVWRSLDHPPLSLYLMKLSGWIFGTSDLGLRVIHVLLGAATVALVYRLGRRAIGCGAGEWAAALLVFDQFHLSWSRVFMPEVPMLFFATAALVTMLRAVERGRQRDFLLLGLLLGVAYLAKETALVLVPALWLYLAVTPDHRAVLRRPAWYAAHIVMLLVVAPDVIGNLRHFDESYLHRDWMMARGSSWPSLKALSLYLGESFRWALGADVLDREYLDGNVFVCHWPAGLLYLAGVVAALKWRRQTGVGLLLVVFAVVIVCFTLLPAGGRFEPFWWASLSLVPAVVFGGGLLDRFALSGRAARWTAAAALAYLAFAVLPAAWRAGPALPRADVEAFVADTLRRAETAIARGDWEEARNRFLFVLNLGGPRAEAYCGLARVAVHDADLPAARRMIDKCLRLEPGHAEALRLREALDSDGMATPEANRERQESAPGGDSRQATQPKQLAKGQAGPPDARSPSGAIAQLTAAIGWSVFLVVVPGVLAAVALGRFASLRSAAPLWSLALNTAALVALCGVLRWSVGTDRVTLVAGWAAWIAVLAAGAWRGGEGRRALGGAARRHAPVAVVGLFAVAGAVVVFLPEQFNQCFCEDGTETFQLARSLADHALPHWEIETWEAVPGGLWGPVVVNPSLVNSYWTFALQTLAGANEASTRWPYWMWSLAALGVAWRMVRREDGEGAWPRAMLLAMSLWLSTVWFTFYVGYNPYMADLANPGVPDALFTLLVLLSLDALRRGSHWGVAVAGILASLVLYSGVVWLAAVLGAAWLGRAMPPRKTLGTAAAAAGALALVVAFYVAYGWRAGVLPYWLDTFDIEYLNDYLAAVPRWQSVPLFAGYFLLGCGIMPAAALVWAIRREPWQRAGAIAAMVYLAVVLGSGFKNLHYLGPMLPIPTVLLLATEPEAPASRRLWRSAAAVGFLAATLVCWPVERQTFTLNRQLGAATTIATKSPQEAVEWARLRHILRRDGSMSWDCDEHTWALYAELDPTLGAPRPLVLVAEAATGAHRAEHLTAGLVGDGARRAVEHEGPAARAIDARDQQPGLPPGYLLLAEAPLPVDVGAEGDGKPAASGRASRVRLYAADPRWAEWLASRRPMRPPERYPWVFRPLASGRFSPHENSLEDVRRLGRWFQGAGAGER